MSTTTTPRRAVPDHVRTLPLKDRMRWARKTAGLSHDKLVAGLGRSNRGHLIKIENGDHTPRADLRAAWADATNVPRELFEDDEDDEADQVVGMTLDQFLEARVRAIYAKVAGERGAVSPVLVFGLMVAVVAASLT